MYGVDDELWIKRERESNFGMRCGDASLYVWDHTSFVWRFEAMIAYWVQVFYLPLKLQVLLEMLFMIGDENAPTQ